MKIAIRMGARENTIRIPTVLLLNPISEKLILPVLLDHAPEPLQKLHPRAFGAFLAEIRRTCRRTGGWTLVEIESAEGEQITITL